MAKASTTPRASLVKGTSTPPALLVAPKSLTAPVEAPVHAVEAPVPATVNPFTAFVATQQATNAQAATQAAQAAALVSMPSTGTAVQQAAKAGFTRTIQNGRGDYTPNSIGALIWQTATALQAATPNTPVNAAAVRLALPHVKPASVSAGLSHWRKFCGTMRVKGVAPAALPAPATPAEVK